MIVRSSSPSRDKGFTLIELLVAMALFGLVTTLLLGFALSTGDISRRTQEMAEVDEGARLAMERMARELREASTVTAANATSLTFRTAFDCDDVGASDRYPTTSELLTYSLDGDSLFVTAHEHAYDEVSESWTPVGSAANGVLVDHITAFAVSFRKDGGNATWGTADTVLLSLTVADDAGHFTRQFETRVTLRNEAAQCWTLD